MSHAPTPATAIPCQRCGAKMVYRAGRFGEAFVCARYPHCRGSRDIPGREAPAEGRTPLERRLDEAAARAGRAGEEPAPAPAETPPVAPPPPAPEAMPPASPAAQPGAPGPSRRRLWLALRTAARALLVAVVTAAGSRLGGWVGGALGFVLAAVAAALVGLGAEDDGPDG